MSPVVLVALALAFGAASGVMVTAVVLGLLGGGRAPGATLAAEEPAQADELLPPPAPTSREEAFVADFSQVSDEDLYEDDTIDVPDSAPVSYAPEEMVTAPDPMGGRYREDDSEAPTVHVDRNKLDGELAALLEDLGA